MSALQMVQQETNAYVAVRGGWGALKEADEDLNDLNRKSIKAFKKQHGQAFLGSINCYDDKKRAGIKDGTVSIYEEYVNQKIYNFHCDFCVPVADPVLEELVRRWANESDVSVLSKISARITKLEGISFIWK